MMRAWRIVALVAALGVLMIVPAGAKAEMSEWNDDGVPIKSDVELPLSGSFSHAGGTVCPDIDAVLKLEPGSTGGITAFQATEPSGCEVTGTLKALGCTNMTAVTGEESPWAAHNTASVVPITGVKLLYHYEGGSFCPKTVTVSGTMTATPDDPEEISSLSLSGTLSSSLGTNVSVGGELEVRPPVVCGYVGTFGL